MFSVATVFLLLASLVAAAGFAVIAQRRLRQLGMLAAIGATQKHLRLVLLTNGAVVGAIGAILGTVVGLALWVVARARHSRPRSTIASTRSACPGRCSRWSSSSRSSGRPPPPGGRGERSPASRSLLALSGRPPRPRPARHSAIAAAALIAVGIGCLALSDRTERRSSSPGSWRRSSARCSWVRWRSASSPGSRARPYRRAPGAARPRPLPGPLRGGARRHHPRSRHRSGGRHHRGGRGEAGGRAGGRRAPQPVRPPDPGVHGPNARPGAHPAPDPDTRPARAERRARPAARRRSRSGGRDPASEGPPTRRAAHRRLEGDRALVAVGSREASRPRRAGPGDRVSTSPRLPCSGTSESTPPRSIRARTSWPTRPSPPTSSSS